MQFWDTPCLLVVPNQSQWRIQIHILQEVDKACDFELDVWTGGKGKANDCYAVCYFAGMV